MARSTRPFSLPRAIAAQEVLHAGVEEEAQEDLSRVAQHHDEGHQRPPRTADVEMAEMRPIHLRLLAGERAQAQIGLGFGPRPMTGDEMAEMIRSTAIAALAHHDVEAAGGQPGEFLQRLGDEGQIGIDLRSTRRRPDPGQPSLRDHPPHYAVMDVQLRGNGAGGPFLGVMIAEDFGLDVRRRHHGGSSVSVLGESNSHRRPRRRRNP
jgi:hypothetical protein